MHTCPNDKPRSAHGKNLSIYLAGLCGEERRRVIGNPKSMFVIVSEHT